LVQFNIIILFFEKLNTTSFTCCAPDRVLGFNGVILYVFIQ